LWKWPPVKPKPRPPSGRRQLVLFLPGGAVWVLDPAEVAAAARKAGQRPALRVGQSRVLPKRRRPRQLYTDLTPETNDET
jgi:hypothetical protein